MANKRWAAGTIKIEGLEEVVRELERRHGDVMAGVEAICHAGAEGVQKEIGGRAVGRLGPATIKETTQRMPAKVTVSVGVQKKLNYIARFQEFGTKQHEMVAKRLKGKKRRAKWAMTTPYGLRRRVEHPGQGKRPFIRPGFFASADEASTAMGRKVKSVVRG